MTDKKFKEQLINLIKTDDEVRSLVSDIVIPEVENRFVDIFIERARTKYEAECDANFHKIPIENENSIQNQLDDYFYYIAREIECYRIQTFQTEMNKELALEHQNKLIEIEQEYQKMREVQQKEWDKQDAYLNAIPKHKLNENRLIEIYDYLITNKMIEGGFDHFRGFCKMYGGKYNLNWIDTKGYNNKSKRVCYPLLFDLMHNIIFSKKKAFAEGSRKIFLTSIMEGMKFDGEYVNYQNLNTAYSSWINQYILIDKL
ncbi:MULTISPECIES: hypothetical protein [unclassified Myroides]|uniref:hypothetical protein n=1 Tax=unclassified Myroides TaxID=2642485 RepID=UPI0031012CF6